MANIISVITTNTVPGPKECPCSRGKLYILKLDGDPTLSSTEAPENSIALYDGAMYLKIGEGDNDWLLVIKEFSALDLIAGSSLERKETLPFIGCGTGASKTTTVIDGNTLSEEMSIGDELFINWRFPPNLDKTREMHFGVGWYMPTTEVGKKISGEISFTITDGADLVTEVTDTIYMIDTDAPTPAFSSTASRFYITLSDYDGWEESHNMHVKFKRVASSNDPIGFPRLYTIAVHYYVTYL